MITYSNIKAYNQIWSPMGRYPMIDNTIFETYAEALAFATTNAVAVVGNIVTVTSDTDPSKNGAYILICDGELTNASQPTGLKKLGSDIDLSNYITKEDLVNIYTYKGSVASYDALPVVNEVGDVYNVEAEFSLQVEQEEGDPIVKNYPAGTNVVWNGEDWDTLAGSVDLSAYATKTEVSEVEKEVEANEVAIANLTTEVAKKVNADDIASDLEQINTNKTDIETLKGNVSDLQTQDQALSGRITTLEGLISGGEIDGSSLLEVVGEHTTKIAALEGDNTINKTNITNLQTQVQNHGERLTAIETLNTEQSNLISNLTTRVEAVEAHGTAITNLTTTVNSHTESISTLTTDVADAKALATSEAAKAEAAAKQFATDEIAKLSFDTAGTAKSLADVAEANAKSYADDKFQEKGNYEIAGTAAELNAAMDERVVKLEAIDHDQLAKDAAASAVATVLDGAPDAFNTLKEVADWIANNDHALEVSTLVTDVAALKAIDHTAYVAADEAVLNTAKTYTNDEIAKLSFDAAGTAEAKANAALDEAKSYTNDKIAELGTASTKDVEFFATAAQGALAETAAQQDTTYTKAEVDTLLGDAFSWINV